MTVAPPEINIDSVTLESLDFDIPCEVKEGCEEPARWLLWMVGHCVGQDSTFTTTACQRDYRLIIAGVTWKCGGCGTPDVIIRDYLVQAEPLKETKQ